MTDTYTLYRHATIPDHYVVLAGDHSYLIPGIPDGWTRRTPYTGYQQHVRPIAPEEGRVLAATYGVPMQGGPRTGAGRKPLGEQAMERHTVTLPAAMVAELKRHGGGNLSSGIRAVIGERA